MIRKIMPLSSETRTAQSSSHGVPLLWWNERRLDRYSGDAFTSELQQPETLEDWDVEHGQQSP